MTFETYRPKKWYLQTCGRLTAAALTTTVLGVFSLAGTAAAQTTTIFACRNDTNGDLRYVTGPGQCRQHETDMSWTSGSSGPNGHGTPGVVPLWTGSGTTLTDSHIHDTGVGVNISVPLSASADGTGPTIGAFSTNGVGVFGASPIVGVLGGTRSASGTAVSGVAACLVGSCFSIGVDGQAAAGVGVRGRLFACDDNNNCTPTGAGDAGQFSSGAGGILLHGYLHELGGMMDEKFVVDAAGNLTTYGNAYKPGGGSWSTLSDARTKKSVEPIGNALAQLLKLRGVTYEYANPSAFHERAGTHIGMVAQDVEQVFPSWVDAGDDGYKRLTFRGFEAVAVEAVRELDAKSNDAAARIAELQHAVEQLSQTVKALRRK
jgi:hypothetical protein